MKQCIIQISDPQLGFFEDNIGFEKELEHLDLAIRYLNQQQPQLVVFSGDLVHAHPDNPLYSLQAEAVLAKLQSIDSSIPYLITNGNHDIGNEPSAESIKLFQSFFGHEFNLWSNDLMEIITFNSQLFAMNVCLKQQQNYAMNWLKKALETPKKASFRFLFMHHPLFIETIEEDTSYLAIAKEHRKQLLSIIAQGNIDACFSGHLHQNHLLEVQGIPFITTSSLGKPLGKDPSGIRKIECNSKQWSHEFCPLELL